MVQKMRHKNVAFALLAALPAMGLADIWFTHDTGVLALPPGPANGVFAQPDVQDVFYSTAYIRTAPGPNVGNALILDNPAILGLLDGDNIDAIHHELRPLGQTGSNYFPAFVFSVNKGDQGLAGTAVRGQVPDNAGDLYESNGFGYNVLDINENQFGLALGATVDTDGYFLTPASEVNRNGWIYFSLTPGSPTLTALGASPADILSAQIGGTPRISILATDIGLDPLDDDVDGMVILNGIDGNGDGQFWDMAPGDVFPMVVFSVSPNSYGLPNTGVSAERAVDFPVGGDIYFSIGNQQNFLFMDDGQYGLGLQDRDDVDGLDLPSMAVPEGTVGGGIIPPGTPFSGGASTPGAPGTPGGPALPPPGGTGGPGGCTPVGSIRFGLCVSQNSSGYCFISIKVFLSCRTPGGPTSLTAGPILVPCDDGDASNGSEVVAAVTALMNALNGLKIPSGPDAGKPVFAGGGAVNTFPPGGAPTHANGTLTVNGALTDCKVTGFATLAGGCYCYTQNVKTAKWDNVTKSIVDWDEPSKVTFGIDEDAMAGVFMMQFTQDEVPYMVDTPAGTPAEVSAYLAQYFSDLGYKTGVKADGMGVEFLFDPFGLPMSEIWGAGFAEGGTGFTSLKVKAIDKLVAGCLGDLNGDRVVDQLDLIQFFDMEGRPENNGLLDFDQSGSVDYFDLSILISGLGGCQ